MVEMLHTHFTDTTVMATRWSVVLTLVAPSHREGSTPLYRDVLVYAVLDNLVLIIVCVYRVKARVYEGGDEEIYERE